MASREIAATGVILAGGFGTRLRGAVAGPKPLAPVRGRPFLALLLDQLVEAGVSDFILCTGHGAEEIEARIGDSYRGRPVRYSREDEPLGTGGALRLAAQRYPGGLWLVGNGDSYIAAAPAPLLEAHVSSGRPATLLLAWVEDCARYGTVEAEEGGAVRAFREKRGLAEPGWINAGLYVLSRSLLESLDASTPLSLERDVFPALAADGRLGACRVRAPFIDIGTPESFAAAQSFFSFLPPPRRAVVLDRDGAIIVQRPYLSSPDEVELLPGAAEGLRLLRRRGFLLPVATNQSGIGRGYFDRTRVDEVHRRMRDLLAAEGAGVDTIYVCPHTPGHACDCRKPETGMLRRAAFEWNFRPEESFVIGDKECDIELGRAAGARTILVLTGCGPEELRSGAARPDFVVRDLAEAARLIEAIVSDPGMNQSDQLIPAARERVRAHILGSIAAKQRLLEECSGAILSAAEAIVAAYRGGGKLLICGNGGSAADSQHMAAELVSVLNQSFLRPGLAAIALTTDSSILTASANDFGYDGIFERQVQALGRPGDVLIGITTSGNSKNVLRAAQYAAAHGIRTIGLTGASGGALAAAVDVAICAPAAVVQHIQEAHITVAHILCDLVEQTLYPELAPRGEAATR